MRTISRDQLDQLDQLNINTSKGATACKARHLNRFVKLFGTETEVTEETIMKCYGVFPWDWCAENLLEEKHRLEFKKINYIYTQEYHALINTYVVTIDKFLLRDMYYIKQGLLFYQLYNNIYNYNKTETIEKSFYDIYDPNTSMALCSIVSVAYSTDWLKVATDILEEPHKSEYISRYENLKDNRKNDATPALLFYELYSKQTKKS